MSYCTWSTYGYGAKIPDSKVSTEKLIEFMKNHLSDYYEEYWKDSEDELDYKELRYEYEGDYYSNCGLASMLSDVIRNEKGIDLVSCDDFDGNIYLLFCPTYPWTKVSEQEKTIKTPEDVEHLINEYWKELSDIPLEFDNQDVQNGG